MKKITFKNQKVEEIRWHFFAWLFDNHPIAFKAIDGKLPVETYPF